MDIKTRDRASQDVAPVPDREPGVPVTAARRVQGARAANPLTELARPVNRQRLLLAALAIGLLVLAWHFNAKPRHQAFSAVPDALCAVAAMILRFGIGGFGLVRLMLPAALRGYEVLWVLPTGGCVVRLGLTQ